MTSVPRIHRDLVVYFGHDRTDSKVISRIEHLRKIGYSVLGITYHRVKFNRDHEPAWENVDLGPTADYAYGQRIKSLIFGAFRVLAQRKRLAEARIIFARNIDMALLALFARLVSRSRAPIAYEVLDVHRFFLGDRWKHRVFRAIERWALGRTDALIVSSEGYIRHYFEPMLGFQGRWFLLENKVPLGSVRSVEVERDGAAKAADRPWVIGWCGTMRCVKSLELLTEIARRNRDSLEVVMRGFPTEIGMDAFLARIEDEPNMIYQGGYKAPDDLAEVYAGVDFNWTIELWDVAYESKNSHWLLPNRLYEGGCCGVPAIAMAGTETAVHVGNLGIGWVIEEPLADNVSALLRDLTVDDYQARRDRYASLPQSTFWDTGDLAQICDELSMLRSSDGSMVVST